VKKYNIALTTIILIVIIALISSCGGAPLLPGSRLYQPISDWEKREFDKANRSIYPDDIRKDLTSYKSSTIAWAGIVKQTEVLKVEGGTAFYFTLEHHYFDWIEDFGIQRERIFLSPKGEGLFKTSWGLTQDVPQSEIEEIKSPGYLLIVYGQPTEIQDKTVVIEASYIRGISKKLYTTERMDYGRLQQQPKISP